MRYWVTVKSRSAFLDFPQTVWYEFVDWEGNLEIWELSSERELDTYLDSSTAVVDWHRVPELPENQ